jgi:hypothetical protein
LPGGRACGEFAVQTLSWSPNGQNLICTGGGPGISDSGVVVLMDGLGTEIATYRLNDVKSIEWAPLGDAFAMVRRDGEIIAIVDSVGAQVAEIGPAELGPGTVTTAHGSPVWSHTGDKLAYWNRDDRRLHIYSMQSGAELVVDRDVRPLFWAGNSELYVASRFQGPDPRGFVSYEANLLTLGATTEPTLVRVPPLDSGPNSGVNTDVWVSPNGVQFAVLIDGEDGPALGLLDDSGEVQEIEGATVDPENRDLSPWAVSFSDDGEYLSWLSGGGDVFRARTDGSGAEKRADVDAASGAFAPDGVLLAYNEVESDGVALVLRDLANGKSSRLESRPMGDQGALYAMAWRPRAVGSGIVHRAQLSYVHAEGAIRLVDSEGTDDHLLAKPCPADTPPELIRLSWSVRGERLAVICPSDLLRRGGGPNSMTLYVLDGEGTTLATVNDAAFVRWPTDERLAYQTTGYLEDPPVFEVRVLELTTGGDELLREDAMLLDWPQYERIILGLGPDYNRLLGGYTYEANLMDTETGELTRVARLDDGAQFWTNPYTGLAGFESRDQAIVIEGASPVAAPQFPLLTPSAVALPEDGASLAVFNMVTGELEPIADSRIRSSSRSILQNHVSLAHDSGSVWWVDEGPGATVIYEAQVLRGGDPGAKEVYRLPAGVLTVLHDGSLAWMEPDGPGAITVVDLGMGEAGRVASGWANVAWRPFSAEYEPPPNPQI